MLCSDGGPLYKHSGKFTDLNSRTLVGKLKTHWESHPEKETFIFHDDDDQRWSLTNQKIQMLSERCASLLRCNGVLKGHVVCNLLPPSLERDITSFGILLTGAILMNGQGIVDRGYRFWEPIVQAQVNHFIVEPSPDSIGWKMVEGDVGYSGADIERCTTTTAPDLMKVFKFRLEQNVKEERENKEDIKSAIDLMMEHDGGFVEAVYSHDPAAICVTKCSLQKHYKLVLRNHQEMCQLAHRLEDMLKITNEDVVYMDWPLGWLMEFPLIYISTGCSIVRSTLIHCPAQRVVVETWKLIEDERCTVASLQPPMIQMLSSHCEDLPEPHWTLRALTTAGLVRQSVMDSIGPCTASIIICYSLIEAGMVSRLVVTENNKTRYSEGCVGDLSNPIRTRFDNQGRNVRPTKIGEVLLQGQLVCKQYHRDPHLTKSAFTADGFLMTGDLGFYDEHDRLFVLGRKTEAIIRGETAIFPREIEEKVNQCPGIWKVKVVSIKDDKGIIQMCACVVPRSDDSLTIDRVKEFCRYQLGGTHDDDDNPHMPTYVFFFDEFPTYKGKVNRRMLAFMASEIIHGNAETHT